MQLSPELVADCHCQLGENPLWNPFDHCLYWTDILAGELMRYDPSREHWEVCYKSPPVGGFTLQADGSLLLFQQRGAMSRWEAGKVTVLVAELPEEIDSRFNDVISDPEGRVFCGTMPSPERLGRLYRLDRDGSLHVILEEIGISNGLGFTPDAKQMYYTDSLRRSIYLFDYQRSSGQLSHQRLWMQTPQERGEPDGLTVDSEGNVWSARWDDGALYHFSASGEELQRIVFPARKVTSAVFGGDHLEDLYVTTALNGGERSVEGPGAGALFRLRPPVPGLPAYLSRIHL